MIHLEGLAFQMEFWHHRNRSILQNLSKYHMRSNKKKIIIKINFYQAAVTEDLSVILKKLMRLLLLVPRLSTMEININGNNSLPCTNHNMTTLTNRLINILS